MNNSQVMMTTTTNNSNHKQQLARKIVDKAKVRVLPKQLLSPPSVLASRKLNCGGAGCFSTQFLMENHSNFKRSAVPARLMYYDDGSWVDFSKDVIDVVRSAFLNKKPMIEVQIRGFRYFFDFYRMLQIDLESGYQRSVAWIDAADNCFFPKTFVAAEFGEVSGSSSSRCQKIGIEIQVSDVCDSNKRKREILDSDYIEKVKEEDIEISASNFQRQKLKKQRQLSVSESPMWPKEKLLKEGEMAHSVVKNLFITWIGVAESQITITAIHQCTRTGLLDRAKYDVFQKQLESTKAARGDPKMTFAWYRSSADDVASILSHGFGKPSKVSGQKTYGVGIYLSPIKSSPMSSMLLDDNGENHIILCRVVLGKCEKVQAGSLQSYPSSVEFDTGVDDCTNPKWYIVWCANMSTHILPECVVSFKYSHHKTGQLTGSSFLKWVPNASNALTANFFSKLTGVLPPSKVRELQTLCSKYKIRSAIHIACRVDLLTESILSFQRPELFVKENSQTLLEVNGTS